jgi:hypothetical protein
MSRKFLIPLVAAVFLIVPALLPRAFVSAIAPSLSGAAQAESQQIPDIVSSLKTHGRGGGGGARGGGGEARMGGGGGRSVSSRTVWNPVKNRMGGGGGHSVSTSRTSTNRSTSRQ